MTMKNLAYTPDEIKEEVKEAKVGGDMPKYPWGLCLNLDDETIKKLGIMLPAVGTVVTIQAQAVVQGVNSRQEADGETCSYVELQITDMELGTPTDTKAVADKLYSK